MKTFFATLALLCAAPVTAQFIQWGDVRMGGLASNAQPVMVGNELGLLFVCDGWSAPFVFENSTPQQLRVHKIYWYLRPHVMWGGRPQSISLIGHETTCHQGAWAGPFGRYAVYEGVLEWQSVDFVIENLTGNYCYYPRVTAWQFQTFSAGGTGLLLSAWVVTAVGGW